MEPNRFRHYIGIDWATEAHRICLLDHDGQPCGKTSIPHSGEGLAQLQDWLAHHGVVPAHAAVGIETPRGAVVETLVERGYAVFAINPKQLERFRDRYTTAGAKDVDRDAWCAASAVAEVLKQGSPGFPRSHPNPDDYLRRTLRAAAANLHRDPAFPARPLPRGEG